jgi:uncharacterized protein (DUF1684 family)
MNYRSVLRFLPFLFSAIMFTGCRQNVKEDPGYTDEMREWRKARLERLKSPGGWLNLAGLYWLREGENTFGSDSTNQIVFPPTAPKRAGIIHLKDSTITIKLNNISNAMIDARRAQEGKLYSDASEHPTQVQMGRYIFCVIRRAGKYGIRLRDLESPALKKLDSIPAYPVSAKWKIKARLVLFDKPQTREINTVIGTTENYNIPGKLIFRIDGREYSILPFIEGEGYFIIFGDETSAIETYAAGRFLSAPAADSSGYTTLDFNKARNPPCAFTPFATCPLPPKDNILAVKITAGEKDVHMVKH